MLHGWAGVTFRPMATTTQKPCDLRVQAPSDTLLSILIVEDEPDVARTLKRVIASCGNYEVRLALGEQAVSQQLSHSPPDLVFTDLVMPEHDGFAVIRQVKAHDPDLPVVVLSAFSTLENAVEAVKLGAFDFLAKPFSLESVEMVLARVSRDCLLRRRVAETQRLLAQSDPDLRALHGNSQPMVRLREWISKTRGVSANVLIEGESGTGKELVARALHAGKGPFVAINMAAMPENLAESELFGYRKGAFSGAVTDHTGLFIQAQGGTLFLDEVNSMSLPLQAKLLRVLAERRLRPLGGTSDLEVDVRLVCAANMELEQGVNQGSFRRDLYHRIKVLHVQTPSLRQRPDDIASLAQHFLQRYARAHRSQVQRLSQEALVILMSRPWPGNVRELENTIEQAVILSPPNQMTLTPASLDGWSYRPDTAQPASNETGSLAQAEQRHILNTLETTGGNKAQAARILQIDYKTLLRKLATPP